MGAVSCEIHELSGLMWVCQHIDEFILSRIKQNKVVLAKPIKDFISITIRELTFPNVLLAYCDKCAEKHQLPLGNISKIALVTIHLSSLVSLKKETVGTCIDCFYKELLKIDLGESKDLPFLNTTIEF